MVKIIYQNNRDLYQCEECGFKYREKELADKCERWCREHHSCNLEITSYAIEEGGALSKKEPQEQRRLEKERTKQKIKLKRRLKNFAVYTGIMLVVGSGVFAGWKWLSMQPQPKESKIIATRGIHWHVNLSIKILGEEQKIPAGIGLGVRELPIHTHETDGVIHLEFSGRVTEDNLRLGEFFKIWGRTFNKDCIFDKCSGSEGQVKMFVNGEQNFEFENYVMQDKDRIEIVYE